MQGDSIPANRAFLHVVHGLRVASSIELPDLALADGDTAAGVDVDISEGDVPDSLGDQATVGAHWQTDATRMLFEAPGIARYLVSDGRTIRFQPCASHARDDHAIRVYMLGTALGVLLHQRGLFALHASGVATPSGAWLFTGHSGAGKSTLVAWLHRRFGWPILSDDVTVIETANGGIQARSGIPRLRLWRDALAALSVPEDGLVRDLVRFDKFQMPLGPLHEGAIPLRGLVLLEAVEETQSALTRLRGHEALATVMGSVYRREFAEAWRAPGSLFLDSARIATSMSVLKFSRPRSLAEYDHHLETLIAGLEGGIADAGAAARSAGTNTATTA